jgi:hypothetical protein
MERIFSHLGRPDLLNAIKMNRTLASYALARLYHSINLIRMKNGEELSVDVIACLRTLIDYPHLAGQVYAFNMNIFIATSEMQLFRDAQDLLPSAIRAISSTTHAVYVHFDTAKPDATTLSERFLSAALDFPRLEYLKLPVLDQRTNLSGTIQAVNLISLECGLGFALVVLQHLPQLLNLFVRVVDEHPDANDTVKAFGLKHPRVRIFTLIVDWGILVRSVEQQEARLLGVVAETDFPCVEKLIFSIYGPCGENVSIVLSDGVHAHDSLLVLHKAYGILLAQDSKLGFDARRVAS